MSENSATESGGLESIEASKKKKVRGFAALIEKQLRPLNTSDYFRQKYGEDCFTLLLVATDDKHAAFLTVKDGHVEVEDVKNEPAELRKVKSNGKIMTSEEMFFSFAMGKVNPVKAILTGKLRIRGYRTVLRFTKYFSVLAYLIKHSNPST